ncbi:transglycosylase domain-containing protein [Desulfitobacterium sp. PCE1]|uniref:transglycosylase domain-containing protein n=1 Tax=Desulfitobacterium sp. PCE1 TaxID=146907 RepID=UPI0003716283|nr:PBP1A family penicillin-binding protein [Desulfitobacterium sp. PCE1]
MKNFPDILGKCQTLLGKALSKFRMLNLKSFYKKPKFWRNLIILLLFVLLTGLGTGIYWISTLDVSKLESPLAKPTYIYDQAGNKISQLSSSRIEPVTLEQVPQHTQEAIIATEDKRFYIHQGVDIRSILRALVQDLKTQNFSEGGSTISQQLAKNLFLTSDKTLSRKLKEAGYAIKIEATLSKDEILESYLNHIYFGEGNWGLQEAAHYYFGKNTEELNLEESALLAGILKGPTIYSPLKNKELALQRRNLVLSMMADQGYITAKEAAQATAAPIVLRTKPLDNLSGKYAPYVDYVIEEAINRYGFTEDQILTLGLQIYTQMDAKVQQAAETVYKDDQFFPQGKDDLKVQSGIAILDQHTGAIRGLVGYRGESAFRQFNRASQLKRQPGSIIKPLMVYGPALEKGYRPDALLYDGPLNLDGYTPKDWDGQTRGWVTMEEAIQQSWNIPAVWLFDQIGIEAGKAFAQKAGIPLTEKDAHLSLALGGFAEGVSPLDIAQAYTAFANQGLMHTAHAIIKITTADGHVLAQMQPESVQVTDSHHAYTMTLLLQNVVQQGTAPKAALGSRPVAGKTGSVELPPTQEFAGISKGQKDVWFVGYTPELTAAIWMGYDQTDREHYLTTSGGSGPAVVFHEVLSLALKDTPIKPFEVPAGYVKDWNIWPEGWDDDEYGRDDDENKKNKKNTKDKNQNNKNKNKDKKQGNQSPEYDYNEFWDNFFQGLWR